MERDGLKLAHVAVACDVDSSTIHRWRSGAGQVPDAQKLRLARLFGVSAAYLMGWEHGSASDHTAPDSGSVIGKAAA